MLEKYWKFRGILIGGADCALIQRRRPIEKAKRSKRVLVLGISLNIAIFLVFSVGLEVFYDKEDKDINDDSFLRYIFLFGWLISFLFALTLFICASCMDPGYIESKFDFVTIIDQALKERVDLNNFCPYDEVVKTETYFHC
jgi:hypothetical protein